MIARLLAAALALLAAGLIAWILLHRPAEAPAPLSTPTLANTSTATAAPPATIVPGYRLAGTALGLRGRYAVFEDPQGSTDMYRVGDEVPGLGTLTRIGEVDAAVQTSAGEMRFQVRPAPTKLPEHTATVRRATKPSPTASDPSESESSPSDEPAPPAS